VLGGLGAWGSGVLGCLGVWTSLQSMILALSRHTCSPSLLTLLFPPPYYHALPFNYQSITPYPPNPVTPPKVSVVVHSVGDWWEADPDSDVFKMAERAVRRWVGGCLSVWLPGCLSVWLPACSVWPAG